MKQPVEVSAGRAVLPGDLTIPGEARGIVLFAHGSGSSRHSPRNQFVAGELERAGIGTLLFDLLTSDEEEVDLRTRELRFDITLLAERLTEATRWLLEVPEAANLPIGYFGASTGAAAALIAAAENPGTTEAVVSRGGRPDLAGSRLAQVKSPTLLIVGGEDHAVIRMNVEALESLQCEKRIEVVPGCRHLFEERGCLEEVSRFAVSWFLDHLS
jgi:putative phosphoribosyl transferase